MLAARHLKFTAQASHPVVAARQVPTPSALLQALVVHQAVALPVRVVAAKRLQQTLIITSGQSSVGLSTNSPGATSWCTTEGTSQYWRWSIMLLIRYSRVQRSLVSHKQAAARIFLFFQPNRVNSIRYEKNQSS